MAENQLFLDYMEAWQASEEHTSECANCHDDQLCQTGTPLHERFVELQNQYREWQAERRLI
ncbi:hypothetical protein OG453_44525 [Streptomyces sp. NBC_01381]|uniref:hypothetical protein n=1 Tax=Streptomyces sp. NBC_01381 TaxID=2903845 RepID=UPI00225678F5|nr:hypothetical protein [Streptomyces sp. NBC_01381]MCX4673625.1 hypothetical protein [Streptomyces sp. NBC_01381]